jgi:hypothetical protein
MVISVFGVQRVISLILTGTLAVSVVIVIRAFRVLRVIRIIRVIRVTRIFKVIWVTRIIRVIRVIRTIKFFRVIRVSRVILIVFRCSWDVLLFLALLFLIRLLESLGLFRFLEMNLHCSLLANRSWANTRAASRKPARIMLKFVINLRTL